MADWREIKTFRGGDRKEIDVWMQIHASPMSMGMSDAFRVVDAYKVGGKWFHRQDFKERELVADYITHWMPIPKPPRKRAAR